MASPELSDLERTAREIVRAAMLEGTLSNLTIRKVRNRIETIYGLEEGFLLAPQYKHSLKAVIQDASAQAKVERKDEEARVNSRHIVAYTRDVAGGIDDTMASRNHVGKYKSAEFVEDSSDLEELSESRPISVSPRKSPRDKIKRKASVQKPPAKKRQKIVDSDNESTIQMLTKAESKTKVQEDSAESDNQIAPLFADSPKSPKSKSKEKTSRDKSRVKKKTGNKSEASGKHDMTIKKLKSLVNACGVRKPWAKIFKDVPKPTQQIKKLREILSELGMTGRMSMEQAKRIRAERELAQELEDVKSFEHSMLNRSCTRTAESSSRPCAQPIESEDEDLEDGKDIKHRRRKTPASRNIDAFIGSDSDDD